jgi:hypothetical protein
LRVVRSFAEDADLVTLERAVPLPALPTMGASLDLRAFGVEAPLSVIAGNLRAIVDDPRFLTPATDVFVFLSYERGISPCAGSLRC